MDDRGELLQRPISTLAMVVTAAAIACFPGHPCAETPHAYIPGDDPFPEEGDFEPRQPNRVDRAQEVMSQSVNDAAKWFDAFFGDERFVAEEAYSRIRLTPSVFFEEGEATDYKLRVNAKIRVPRMSKRLRLVIGDTSEDCLYLNVRTGNLGGAEKQPVMVWIHHVEGSSGWRRQYSGASQPSLCARYHPSDFHSSARR